MLRPCNPPVQDQLDRRHLIQHFGNPETTMIPGESYIAHASGIPANQQTALGMMVPFNAVLYLEDNGCVISREGKPPDTTGNGPILAYQIPNASNKAGDIPRPLHFKKKTAASL